MAIDNEYLKELESFFDDRYVLKSSCNEKQQSVDRKFADDDKRIVLIAHDFNIIKKLMWAIASASIGSLAVAFFELILR